LKDKGVIPKMRAEEELSQRQQEILATVVRLYVSTGVPVGSKAAAARSSEPLSSATIRNVMAELEAHGFLLQRHASAGRIPSDKAYRFYVDRMARLTRLGAATERYIEDSLGSEPGQVEGLMERISILLSKVSHNLGLVLGPALEQKLLEQIKFVRLSDQRVLAVIVSKPDLVVNKVFRAGEDYAQPTLDRAAEFLNEAFRGWSLKTIRLEIGKRLEDMRDASDHLLATAARLFIDGALAEEEPGDLFVAGATRIFNQPDFVDAVKLKKLMVAIEEKAKVIQILNACLDAPDRGVQVVIGRENPNSEMRQCSFILAPYHYRRRAVGALGVIGPTRMEYDRAMQTVEYVARVTSRLLSAN
jgi:heat-inducible transcriptional repressor